MTTFVKLPEGYRFYYTIHPRPTVVLITRCPGNRINAMPASWNTPVSEEPPTVAIAVEKDSYTHTCLGYCNEVTINIPPASMIDVVYSLGTVSGSDVDKIKAFGLELEKSETVSPPRWKDSLAVLEGRVYKRIDVGEVTLFVFEITGTYVRFDYYTRWGWDFRKTNVLLHNAGRGFYLVGKFVRATNLYGEKRKH